MTIGGFPNLFMIHGPGSPGVFYNMPLGAERQIDWIGDFMRHLEKNGVGAVEPKTDSEEAWANEVSGLANATLFPRTDSWWTGANIEGKPRYFSAYLGGSIYYMRIADVAAKGYEGFAFEPAQREDDAAAP
jgi:cyclohexanone monooxygenase